MAICGLCFTSKSLREIGSPDNRAFLQCGNCRLVQTNLRLNENSPGGKRAITDRGFVASMKQLIDNLSDILGDNQDCLDYGCGTVPTLAVLLQETGKRCDYYDPVFFPHTDIQKQYDLVFGISCMERAYQPGKVMRAMVDRLKPGGYLVTLTETYTNADKLRAWPHATDISLVSFFHDRTFDFMAERFKLDLVGKREKRIFIFRKPAAEQEALE